VPEDLLDLSTLGGDPSTMGSAELVPLLRLTVLGHPSAARVGDTCTLPVLGHIGAEVVLNRAEPVFHGVDEGPLRTPFLSRRPVTLTRERAAVRLDPGALAGRIRLEGRPVASPTRIPLAGLGAGVVLRLGTHVVLLLHQEVARPRPEPLGMVGQSQALDALRQQILHLSNSHAPALIRGATGSGKEGTARALHDTSDRRRGPFVALNMAAVPPQLAASQLFGHVRGAFSGAHTSQDGLFVAADGGTLFLDEIGDTPDEVQAALLRVLEMGEVLPVGSTRSRRVDVRVLAATDVDLEAAIEAGRFRSPLYWRLAATQLDVPTLGERRADIGRLLVHFLKEALPLERASLLEPDPAERKVWLSADVVERLALHPWPGNVRELRNVALSLAPLGGHGEPLRADDVRIRLADRPKADAQPPTVLRPRDISDALLEETLEAVDFALGAAAERLGISRPSLNDLVDAHPRLMRPKYLTDAQIDAGRAQAKATGQPLWRVLRVSKRGLSRRLSGADT
jgi:two-component system nitrogen regulation response regulator GlnG